MTVVDAEKEEIVNHFPVGRGIEGGAVHPNGKQLYVANQEDDTLFVINVETLDVEHKRCTGFVPIRIVFSPDFLLSFYHFCRLANNLASLANKINFSLVNYTFWIVNWTIWLITLIRSKGELNFYL
ncbi:MAG: YncE family protein [Anaerobacillus sp.]|uniref:YncE family protein n=1 Tax=Anaerobacillus sp. TaxID=1872506 RepID=UPI00391A6EEC